MGRLIHFEFDGDNRVTQVTFPRFLFRYRRADDYLISSIEESTLWFSQRADFNDPFEVVPSFDFDGSPHEFSGYVAQIFSSVVGEDAAREIASKAANMDAEELEKFKGLVQHVHAVNLNITAFCCFSVLNDNVLMWSHYADAHKGVCLVYDFADLALTGQFSAIEVEYHEKIPKFSYFRERSSNNLTDNFNLRFDQVLFGTKLATWEYEHEIRLLSRMAGANTVPAPALRGVIFGVRCDEDDRSRVKRAFDTAGVDYDTTTAVLDAERQCLVVDMQNYAVSAPVTNTVPVISSPDPDRAARFGAAIRATLSRNRERS